MASSLLDEVSAQSVPSRVELNTEWVNKRHEAGKSLATEQITGADAHADVRLRQVEVLNAILNAQEQFQY